MARKTAAVLLGLVLALVGAELAVRSVVNELPDPRAWPTPETQIKIAQIEELHSSQRDLDVVFIGSSVLESGVDPDLLRRLSGLESYNAALPFSSPLGNEVWLRDFVLARLQPRTVVIGLGVWPNQSTAADDLLSIGLNAIDRTDGPRVSELLYRRQQIRNWSLTSENMRRIRSGLITPLGHQTVYYDLARPPGGGPAFSSELSATMSTDNRDALVRTVELLRSESIDVIILIEPAGCPPIREACPDFDLDTHPGPVLARDFGIPLIDTNVRDWPRNLYADSAHLNRLGTQELTEFVSNQLALRLDR